MAKDSPLRLVLGLLTGIAGVIFCTPVRYSEVWIFIESYPPALPGAFLLLINVTAVGLLMTSFHFFRSFKVE